MLSLAFSLSQVRLSSLITNSKQEKNSDAMFIEMLAQYCLKNEKEVTITELNR